MTEIRVRINPCPICGAPKFCAHRKSKVERYAPFDYSGSETL